MKRTSAGCVALGILASAACGGSVASSTTCDRGGACGGAALPDAPGGAVAAGPAPVDTPLEGELASGLESPWRLAVDAANVYFSMKNEIMACRKSGCGGTPTELASVRGYVGGIVSDDAEVFWTDSQVGVLACAAAGCGKAPRVVASVKRPMALTLANGTLYWTTNEGLVQRCAKNCTAPETLATDSGRGDLWSIAVLGANLYWTLEGTYDGAGPNGAVRTCSIEGPCAPRTLADRQNAARHLAVRNGTMAWVSDGESTVRRCSLPACTDVTAMPLAGQLGIAMDDEKIYWSYASGGWLASAGYGGTGMTRLAGPERPTFLTTDATNLYWIDTDIADSRGGKAGTGRIVSQRRLP